MRIKIVITEHTVGPQDCRVLNRSLPENELNGDRAPRLFRGDHVEMDDKIAFEIMQSERAVPADKDTVAAFEAVRAAELEEEEIRDQARKTEADAARAAAAQTVDAARKRFAKAKAEAEV